MSLMKLRSHSLKNDYGEKDLLNRNLPDDVLIIIFNNLSFINQCVIRRVCSRWKILIEYLFSKRTVLAINNNKDSDEPESDSVEFWQFNNITDNDCIGPKCRTVKDGSLELYVIDDKILKQVFTLCPNITTFRMTYSLVAKFVLELFKDTCPEKLEYIDFSDSQGLIEEIVKVIVNKCGPNLKFVILNNSDVSESCIDYLIKNSPNLTGLNINNNYRVIGNCFNDFKSGLKQLAINRCLHITENDIETVNSLTKSECKESLRYLECGLIINDITMDIIVNNFTNLTYFEVNCHIISDRSISCLSKLKQLEYLILALPRQNCDQSLIHITKGCRKLKKLSLSLDGKYLTDASLKYIGEFCPLLEYLLIDHECGINKKITNVSLNSIAKLNKLSTLVLVKTYITDELIKVINQCKSTLSVINVTGCKKVTISSLFAFIDVAKSRPDDEFVFISHEAKFNIANIETPSNLEVVI